MEYINKWQALSSRIKGLAEAGELHAVQPRNAYGATMSIGAQALLIVSSIESFKSDFQGVLSPQVKDAIDRFLTSGVTINGVTGDARDEQIWALLVKIRAFESEVTYLLKDTQRIIQSLAERAFEHLQRSIIADSEFKNKWDVAFNVGESACEKLGAVHLLQHGIWAFKANAHNGGKTDLVYQDAINITSVERTHSGLVLTEWKKFDGSDANKSFSDAVAQAKIYMPANGTASGMSATLR